MMRNQIIGRRAADGGLLPTELACCEGVTYSYIALGDDTEASRLIVVEQHSLWCFRAR
jgi:hypothetical protein